MEQPSKKIQPHHCSFGIFERIPKDLWRLLLLKIGRAKTFMRLYQCCRRLKQLALEMSARLLETAEALRMKESYAMALQQLLKSALTRNPRAMFHIGMAFRNGGWTLARDFMEAHNWLFRAAFEFGSCAALVNIITDEYCNSDKAKILLGNDNYAKGMLYFQSSSDIESFKTGFTLLLCAAAAGDEYAMYEIWNFNEDLIRQLNDNIMVQEFEAYLIASAKKGYAIAQYELGRYLRRVKKDMSTGETWMYRAAAQGIVLWW